MYVFPACFTLSPLLKISVHVNLGVNVLLVISFNSSDVTGVEIAGALKNVLAIAAGIVEGMNLGNNSMAALVAQGCSEIRWLATKVIQFLPTKSILRLVTVTFLLFSK